ncbi:MAG: hypothetical protein ABJI96_22650 [Paracoccaceae bacterium]
MTDKQEFRGLDYAQPFELMVGTWTGHSITYDAKGKYLFTGPSILYIHWHEPGEVLHYLQKDLGNLDELEFNLDDDDKVWIGDIIKTRNFELKVSGKSCRGKGGGVAVKGVESTPGTYLFHLNFPHGNYYNNQFFPNPNERHIIGPFVPTGKTDAKYVVSQTFSRISYDVPEKLLKED